MKMMTGLLATCRSYTFNASVFAKCASSSFVSDHLGQTSNSNNANQSNLSNPSNPSGALLVAKPKRQKQQQASDSSEEEGEEVRSLQRVAERLLEVDPHLLPTLLDLVGPFVERVRRGFIEEGWLTFDGLLARARALLRDHPEIRERLKQEYRSLLVDEFQDTDPVQYEIVLYLCERQGRRASSWRDTELEPGKLFIVGDPKQSIYAFRRADIEAFDHVVSRLEREGALVCTLATNFRSDVQVLDVVNGVFDKLLVAQASVQPGNVPLAVQPNRASQFPDPGVRLRFIAGGEEESDLDAAGATRAEAELVAAWLARLLPVKTRDGASPPERSLRPGQTALLFRKLTQAEVYLQALHRHGIRYIIDGEKHFYRRQEIIDLVNLLPLSSSLTTAR